MNDVHYYNNDGICALLDCELRSSDRNTKYPCGSGCVYDENECKKICENDYNDENGICIKSKAAENNSKSSNNTTGGIVVVLSIIIGLCVIVIIVVVVVVIMYMKKKKK
jgi:hypothetical protein